MNNHPSWSSRLLTFAASLLAAAYCLDLAARWVVKALPVLLLLAVVAVVGAVYWRRYRDSDHW